jgi:hypothetical protein
MASTAKSDAGGDELLQLCRQRLDAFREQRGEEVICLLIQKPGASATAAARRSRARSSTGFTDAPGAAASAAGQAVAWQTPHQRALEVHPIVPRNHGGTGDISNLQALGCRCNAGKRDGCLPTQESAPSSVACKPGTHCARRAVCSAGLEGLRTGAGGERTGAVHRRWLSGDAWAQPGCHSVARSGWVGAAPA